MATDSTLLDFKVDSTFKFTYSDVAIKDVKISTTTTFHKSGKVRIVLPKMKSPPCCDATDFTIDDISKAKEILLVVFKVASIDSNKGILPVQIWSGTFSSIDPTSPAISVSGDVTATFWSAKQGTINLGLSPAAAGKFYYFNPNNVDVIIEAYFGYNP